MTEADIQNNLWRMMEDEIKVVEDTYQTAGLCIGNIISLLEARVHELREEESKLVARMQEDPPVVGENEEHRLTVKELV